MSKENQIIPVSVFQKDRLCQLEDGIHNVNNVERIMAQSGCEVVFAGHEDNEIQVDKAFIKTVKYGLAAILKELQDEGLGDVAKEIVKINKDILKT